MNDQVTKADKPSVVRRLFHWLFSWRTIRRALIAFACFATLVALFYTEENWRGKRAWENCKRELEAKGVVLDWNAYIPPPVPDEQNFFKAPGINESNWVGRGSRELSTLLNAPWQGHTNPLVVADLTIASPGDTSSVKDAKTILRLDDPTVRTQAEQLIRSVIGPSLPGTHGFYPLVARPLDEIKPAVAKVVSDKTPTAKELLAMFPATIEGSHVQIKSAGNNSFRVLLDPSVSVAGDYLRSSDPFEADFDVIREALKRPYTRMDGDYSVPATMPIPNFITMRTVAQVLAERAKCFLLLGDPDKALRELTLLRDVCRVLESKPTGKPMTLVAAMINVAITGLYLKTVEEGMRLQAWREPQLAELEKQLSEINLVPQVFRALDGEAAAVCRSMETLPGSRYAATIFFSPPNPSLREKLKNPDYLLISMMPRGWEYQNMANIAMMHRKISDSFDLPNNLVLPGKVKSSTIEIEKFRLHRPYTFLAAISVPNFTRATQTLAHNQTQANQAQIACALERYRLAHGNYPETLDALAPQFIEKIPHDLIGGQPLHYRRTDDGNFLLYSVGWNEKDDGGTAALNKGGREDLENGDWVWQTK